MRRLESFQQYSNQNFSNFLRNVKIVNSDVSTFYLYYFLSGRNLRSRFLSLFCFLRATHLTLFKIDVVHLLGKN